MAEKIISPGVFTDEIDGKVFDTIVGASGGGNFGAAHDGKIVTIDDGDNNTLVQTDRLILGATNVFTGDVSASGNLGLGSIGTGASYITASISSVVTASLHASGAYSHIRFENLPKTQPNISGALWLSGSDTVGQSKHLVVFTG